MSISQVVYSLKLTGATTVGTGETGPQLLRWWGPTTNWSSNFLTVLFRKQVISQQVYCFTISIWLFLVPTTRATEKLNIWVCLSPWHACCLLGYTHPREPTNKRCSHQNAGFSIWVFKNLPGVIPGHPQPKGATPSCIHPSTACGRVRGASAPVLGPKPWSSLTFRPSFRPCLN